jgi:hypothetical protein
MFAYQTKRNRQREGYVPAAGHTTPFPMFCNDEDPW